MIPKIIHYCWFGKGEMPTLAKKCLKSWKKFCPDYELMIWNEDNFDINSNQYVREAYENKKYAFVTDYVRLYALYHHGGIYMDTDVEVIKQLDSFLNCKAFLGYESANYVQTGLMACEKNFPIMKELLEYYDNRSFLCEDGSFDLTTNVKMITDFFVKKGLILDNSFHEISDCYVYPSDYFCPIDWYTKKKRITKNTHVIHWYSGSWISPEEKKSQRINKRKMRIRKIMDSILGSNNSHKIINFLKGKKENE